MQPQNSDTLGIHVTQSMENILSFLNRYIEPWLGFGSTFLNTGSNYIFLSGVGFILLYLWYLIWKPFFPPPWKNQDIEKWQDTVDKGRRRSLKGCRISQKKIQEQRKLLSVVQSPLGELFDVSHFRQLLCPDPFCGVCNGATAKISRLLSQATLQDGAFSMSSMDSTVSVTETPLTLSFPPPENTVGDPISDLTYESSLQSSSIISPHQSVHLEDTSSASPLGDSLLSESPVNDKCPLDHDSLHPLTFLPLPQQHATQETELLLQPATVLSLVGSPWELYTNVPINKGICSSDHAAPEFIQQQTDPGNPSQLEPEHSVNQELLDLHSPEPYLWGNTTTYLTLPGNFHFSNLGTVALLETQDGEMADSFKTWGKTSEFDHQNLAVSHPLGSSKETLHIPQKLPYSQTSEDQLEDKHTQFFCGLPSLHSESMKSIATVLTDSSLISGCFNRFLDSPMLTHHTTLTLPESQLHNLSQSLSQSQYQPIPQANPQAQLQSPIPVLSPSFSQLRVCGVYFHSSQDEAQPLDPSAIHCLEYNILKKEQEKVWGLPTVVKNSQQEFCPPPPKPSLVTQPSKIHVPRSISLENCFITSELRKKFEHHLRKRLILQCWGLPKRIRESLLWMSPQAKLPESSSSKNNYGLSWISFFKQQGRKDLHNIVLNQPGSFPAKQLEKKLLKAKGHSRETVQKQQMWSNTQGTLDNGLQPDCETNLHCHSDSPSCKPSGTSEVSQCQKKLETSLKERLTMHLNETNEGQITSTMSRSRHGPFPFTSCVTKEEHKAQKPSDNKAWSVKSTFTVKKTSFVLDNTSLEESESNRHSSDVPGMLAEVGSVPLGKRLNSGKRVQGPQVTKMIDKKAFVSNKVGKEGQLNGLQP